VLQLSSVVEPSLRAYSRCLETASVYGAAEDTGNNLQVEKEAYESD